jgi:hypothetical protein
MTTRNCRYCQRPFEVAAFKVERGIGVFCSLDCSRAGRRRILADQSKKNRSDIVSYIRSRLDYDPNTGILTFKPDVPGFGGKRAGSTMPSGYRVLTILDKRTTEHRWIWLYANGVWPTYEIDHINGVKDDNRLCNLREATPTQNKHNTAVKRSNTTGLKGAYKNGSRFSARIRINGKRHNLGSFDTAEEAKAAYDAKAREVFGDFAKD